MPSKQPFRELEVAAAATKPLQAEIIRYALLANNAESFIELRWIHCRFTNDQLKGIAGMCATPELFSVPTLLDDRDAVHRKRIPVRSRFPGSTNAKPLSSDRVTVFEAGIADIA